MISGLPAFANDEHALLLVAEMRGPAGVIGVEEGVGERVPRLVQLSVLLANGAPDVGAVDVVLEQFPRERVAH